MEWIAGLTGIAVATHMVVGALKPIRARELSDEKFVREARRPSLLRTGLQGVLEPEKRAAIGVVREERRKTNQAATGEPPRTVSGFKMARALNRVDVDSDRVSTSVDPGIRSAALGVRLEYSNGCTTGEATRIEVHVDVQVHVRVGICYGETIWFGVRESALQADVGLALRPWTWTWTSTWTWTMAASRRVSTQRSDRLLWVCS
jgi:hypothetical protein